MCKNGMTNNIVKNTNSHNNKTFNLHFFLNETCKDAMNIMDFVFIIHEITIIGLGKCWQGWVMI